MRHIDVNFCNLKNYKNFYNEYLILNKKKLFNQYNKLDFYFIKNKRYVVNKKIIQINLKKLIYNYKMNTTILIKSIKWLLTIVIKF